MSTWGQWIAHYTPLLQAQKTDYELRFVHEVLSQVGTLNPQAVRSQVPFSGPTGEKYFMDFAIKEPGGVNIAIEVDGWDKRATGAGMTRREFSDFLKRQTALSAQGWMVLRFANGYFTKHPDLCIRQIDLALQTSRSTTGASENSQRELERLRAESNDVEGLRREVDEATARAGAAEATAAQARARAADAQAQAQNAEKRRQKAVGLGVAAAVVVGVATFFLVQASDEDMLGVPPLGTACPASSPVKGNRSQASSERIFHVPGGRFYDDTTPIRCFAGADEAVAAGYRASRAG